MGNLHALALPEYLDKWGVRYELCPHWDTVSRASGGWDAMQGIIIHHDAIPARVADTWAASMPPRVGGRRVDGPVGNGSLEHDGRFRFWCARASNTSGQGGPILGSRGVIAKDNANRTTFNIEARNDGVSEPWTPEQVAAYPVLCAAVLDWANHETPGADLGAGDVWAHAVVGPGWTNRKVDPRGPSPWAPAGVNTWDMNAFRRSVFVVQMSGPPDPNPQPDPRPDPDPEPPEENDMDFALIIAHAGTGATAVADLALKSKRSISGNDAGVLNSTGRYAWKALDGDTFDRIPEAAE